MNNVTKYIYVSTAKGLHLALPLCPFSLIDFSSNRDWLPHHDLRLLHEPWQPWVVAQVVSACVGCTHRLHCKKPVTGHTYADEPGCVAGLASGS